MVVTKREAKHQEYDIHPTGWENDPEEERFRLSLFDPIILVVYCHFALFFRLDDAHKDDAADVLRRGLEKTLSQVRHLCGTLEKDEGGGFSFVKKKTTTVRYVVKSLEGPEYPSIDDLEKATFSGQSLGDHSHWAIDGMPYGEGRAESNPYNSPILSGFQLNFVRGGAMLSTHLHHWAADLVGWRNFTRQLADNCRAIWDARGTGLSSPQWPSWDPACIDVSRFTKQLPADQLVDGPPVAPRHPDLPASDQWVAVLFHIPQSKAAALKKLAQPADGGWVSTYDAMCAFVWRHITRVRVPYYAADPSQPAPWFGESVDMRPRFHNPDPPARMIRNMLTGGFSDMAPPSVQLPTVGELAAAEAETPLARIAGYVRSLTNSVTQESVEAVLAYIATLRNQQSISFNLMAKPPLSLFITDHRPADATSCDFGFARPLAHRFLTGGAISANLAFVYPPQASAGGADDDNGTIWSIGMEKDLVPKLLADPEWNQYVEYRGVD